VSKDDIIAEKDAEISALKFENTELKKLIYGSKSERFSSSEQDPEQGNLFVQEEQVEPEKEVTEQISYERTKGKKDHPGRHALPEHLPVEEVIIEPEIDTSQMIKIGEQVTETLEYTPASLVKKRTIRPKYINKKSEQIYIGQLPSRPIPKSIAEASLLSHILVSKIVDHLPFYRQSQMYSRDFGWKVNQSTMNDWFVKVSELLQPLYESLKAKVLSSTYIQADESPIKVLEYRENSGKSPPKKIMQGYQWVYLSPKDKWVLFQYRKGRGKQGPKEMLANYMGYVQCDGYQVYDKIGQANNDIILVGCWAHARRKFFEAKDNDPKRANYALEIIQQMYKIDKEQDQNTEKIRNLADQLRLWINEEAIKVLPKSPMGKAMNYFLRQWHKLEKVFEEPRLMLDNNWIENKIRPLALGRKNYLFAGSHKGAQRLAMMYSFFGTCKMHDINPREWLSDTLENIADHPINKIEELLPGFMQKV